MVKRFLQEGRLGRTWVTRLMPGDELLESIVRVTQEAGVARAVVLSALGSVHDVAVRDARGGVRLPVTTDKVNTVELAGPFELVSLQGMIVPGEDGPFCHLHPTLGDENGRVWGGHLLHGTVFSTVELLLAELLDLNVVKRHSEETGLPELEPE